MIPGFALSMCSVFSSGVTFLIFENNSSSASGFGLGNSIFPASMLLYEKIHGWFPSLKCLIPCLYRFCISSTISFIGLKSGKPLLGSLQKLHPPVIVLGHPLYVSI